jgi:hypothetical protein
VTSEPHIEHGFKKPTPKFHLRPERHDHHEAGQQPHAAQPDLTLANSGQPAEPPVAISPVSQATISQLDLALQQVQAVQSEALAQQVLQHEALMQQQAMQQQAMQQPAPQALVYEMPADSELSNDRPIVDYGVPVYQGAPASHQLPPAQVPVHYEVPVQPSAEASQIPAQYQAPAAPISDSIAAVSELEELISEARESQIANDYDLSAATSPAAALQFFSNSIDEEFEIKPAQAQYSETVDPNSIIRSVTIAEAPPVHTHRSLSAMDILDNVLEAVATGDPAAANATLPASQVQANSMNSVKNEEDELPLATL